MEAFTIARHAISFTEAVIYLRRHLQLPASQNRFTEAFNMAEPIRSPFSTWNLITQYKQMKPLLKKILLKKKQVKP
jgi:hypothetical protein